jgi:ABC-type phosphate/phosphonate transport system substrate-binding protein
VHPRVAAEVVARIRRAFTGMKADPDAAEILRAASCPGFVAADDADYERVRTIYREAAE